MKAFVHTLGCRVNQYESHVIAERLEAAAPPAGVHVVNTCTVTGLADRKSRQLIARLRRQHPEAVVVAVGCGADGSGDGLRRAGANLVVGNRDKGRIVEVIRLFLDGQTWEGRWESLDHERVSAAELRVRAVLKVQDGCTVGCSFCRTWQVRGPLRSKTPAAARAEAEALAQAGHREIVLVGINLAQYGEDLPSRPGLVDLLGEILEVSHVRIRLSSLNPDGLGDNLIRLFSQERRLCPYLHLPLQSGDDAVLESMGRPYTRDSYVDRARAFLASVPRATVGADVMVGFPGEDEAAFARTVDLLDSLTPLNVHVFRYSPRPGTGAARLSPPVSPAAAVRRASELAERAERWTRAVGQSLVGQVVEVIVEEEAQGKVWGRSENYLWVGVRGGEGAPRGTIIAARLVEAESTHAVGVKTDSTEDDGNRVR